MRKILALMWSLARSPIAPGVVAGQTLRSSWLKRLGWFLLALLLSLSLHLVPTLSYAQSPITDPAHLVQQGRDAYQSGQYPQAVDRLEQAVSIYDALNVPLNQALALSYLALAYQELGDRPQAEVTLQASLALLPNKPESESQYQVQAQVLNTQGELLFDWGQLEAAISSWQAAAITYEELNDPLGTIGTQINQIHALRAMGHYRRAKRQTDELEAKLSNLPDSNLVATAWRSLGNTQYAMGENSRARISLENSLALAQTLNSSHDIAAALLSLGNLERSLGDRQLNQQLLATLQSPARQSYCPDWSPDFLSKAVLGHYYQAADYYQQAIRHDAPQSTWVRSQLNHLSLAVALREAPSSSDLDQLYAQLQRLPPGRFAVYANIRFAQDLTCLPFGSLDTPPAQLPLAILDAAIQTAKDLGDVRAESYALGSLGRIYELKRDELDGAIARAKANTSEAMKLAQQIQAPDIAYRWQWQMGRLLKEEDRRDEAVDYYGTAFENLKNLRSDLVVLDTDIQFSFRESIEPLYRQFAELLLQPSSPPESNASEISQANLRQARDVLEALQLAELDNFFRDACSDIEPETLDKVIDEQDRQAAVLYTIILPERLDVVLKLPRPEPPNGDTQAEGPSTSESELQHYFTQVPAEEVRNTVLDFRRQLVRPDTIRTVNEPARRIYEWLIQPLEADLETNGIEHIVFVLDGVLRNIPMAALHDGDRHLVDRYAVSLSPGLQILETEVLPRQDINILAAGLSERIAGFPPLPNVETELEAIASTVPTATRLLNQEFTEFQLQTAVAEEPISIVHLATHGQFSSQAEETFILAYDDKIDVNELNELLRRRDDRELAEEIELLVLSACQTASGDERAALGLAGVAVRAGARSTLASLWSVDDRATALLVSEFYRQLYSSEGKKDKAEALKQAQQHVKGIEVQGIRPYEHPRYWSAFVLLGNWM